MIRNIVFDMGMVLLRYEPLIACLRYAQGDREKALRRHLLASGMDGTARWRRNGRTGLYSARAKPL